MKQYLKSVMALTLICAVTAVLLAVVNSVTAPIIEEHEAAAANEALLVVMPDGKDFETVDLSTYELPATIVEAYHETNTNGYVFKMETAGYSSGFSIMCGVNAEGIVTGAVCLGSSETLGYEKTYGEQLGGVTLETVETVDTIAGATKTTAAYRGAVKDALSAFIIVNGGSVDFRSEEEILADQLNELLPAAEGAFTDMFIAEQLEGVDTIYAADNGSGYVYVSGETYVAVDASGAVISEVDAAIKANIEAQAQIMLSSSMEELDLSGYEVPKQVVAVYQTASGNYVFDLEAAGFGINGDEWYKPSGEYIQIKVSATPEGQIISCKTMYQSESEGIGSVCEEADFYTQFNGRDVNNYKDIDAISGATLTTNGYKTAISKVFDMIAMLKGEA